MQIAFLFIYNHCQLRNNIFMAQPLPATARRSDDCSSAVDLSPEQQEDNPTDSGIFSSSSQRNGMHAVKARTRSHPGDERRRNTSFRCSSTFRFWKLKFCLPFPRTRAESNFFSLSTLSLTFPLEGEGETLAEYMNLWARKRRSRASKREDDKSKQHGTEKKFRKYQRWLCALRHRWARRYTREIEFLWIFFFDIFSAGISRSRRWNWTWNFTTSTYTSTSHIRLSWLTSQSMRENFSLLLCHRTLKIYLKNYKTRLSWCLAPR